MKSVAGTYSTVIASYVISVILLVIIRVLSVHYVGIPLRGTKLMPSRSLVLRKLGICSRVWM